MDKEKDYLEFEEDDVPYTTFCNELIKSPYLTAMQLRLYEVLRTYKGYTSTFPSLSTLEKECNCSRQTVISTTKHLENMGLLTVKRDSKNRFRGNASNRYRLRSYIKWLKDYSTKWLKNSKKIADKNNEKVV